MTWRDAVALCLSPPSLSLSLVSAAYAVAVHGAIRSQSALYSTPLDRALALDSDAARMGQDKRTVKTCINGYLLRLDLM